MKSLKFLFIGNSFSDDTTEYAVEIAKSLGVEKILIGNLYFGGCSIAMHYNHIVSDSPVYTYRKNSGDGWINTPNFKISDAIKEEEWDWIGIQHGTIDKSRYTSAESYEKLTTLIEHIKTLTLKNTKIAFNLTWLGESTRQHHEILSYKGDMTAMRKMLVKVTKEVIIDNPNIDLLIPTGTALENARTSNIGLLTRDCYHLSVDKGRYIAALTFIATVTGLPFDNISWTPEGVDDYALKVAIESAKNAIDFPLDITRSIL